MTSNRSVTNEEAAPAPRGGVAGHGLAVIDHLMASGELLPAQMPAASTWSPAKKLAAAVFASAMVEIRDHTGSSSHRRRIAEALEWVESDDETWPYSFLRLCALFDLEPAWVRAVVREWLACPAHERKPILFLYRQAA